MMTSAPSPESGLLPMDLPLIAWSVASHVRTFRSPEEVLASKVNEAAYGQSSPELLASLAPDMLSWRTSQLCLVEGSTVFSETWPRSGMMRSGIAYQLPPLAPLTDATASGLWPTPNASSNDKTPCKTDAELAWKGQPRANGAKVQARLQDAAAFWPTPRANDAEKRGNFDVTNPRNGLPAAVKLWPTPQASDIRDRGCLRNGAVQKRMARGKQLMLSQVVSSVNGMLNPTWVEWLMGYPIGHTDYAGSETP
jgi:hypothetical protein